MDIYFRSLKNIVETKKLKIISFLYPNVELKNYELFHNIGSYFKHYYGKRIIDDIFFKEKVISILLNKNNFDLFKNNVFN